MLSSRKRSALNDVGQGEDTIVRGDEIHAADLSAPESAEQLCAAVQRLAAAWGLQTEETSRLLGLSEAEYALWVEVPTLTPAILLRLSYVFGIHADLTRLLPAAGRAARWMRQPNTAALFGGGTALEYLLERDVAEWVEVRNYLSAQFG